MVHARAGALDVQPVRNAYEEKCQYDEALEHLNLVRQNKEQ